MPATTPRMPRLSLSRATLKSMERIFACLLLLLTSALPAETLFRDSSPLELALSGPLDSMFENRENDQEQAFDLVIDGEHFPAKVRVRGNSRLRVCDFPPLRLNLKTGEMADTVFRGEDKLKLVTHCRNYERAEKDLLEEYLVYRMFSHLTDSSFRTRLLRIRYEDTDTGDVNERFAFALESVGDMRKRLGAKKARRTEIRRSELNPQHAALVYVFAYLVGNTDWSLVLAEGDDECCHNGILLEPDNGKLLFIPYDFDLAGLVDAAYARPDPSLRIDSVTTRRYRGYCVEREALGDAVDAIVNARGAFHAMIDELPLLSTREKNRKKNWLERVYREAQKRERLLDRFEQRCL